MKILVTIAKDMVSHRFDLASEVVLAEVDKDGNMTARKNLVLPTVSADDLCHLILTENVDVVVCGGIAREYYEYLTWKKVKVIDSVIGHTDKAVALAARGELEEGAVLMEKGEGT